MRYCLAIGLAFSLACAAGPKEASTLQSAFTVASNPNVARARRAPPANVNDAVKGRYVVKLKNGGQLASNGRGAAGGKADEALGRAGAKRARPVHRQAAGGTGGLYAVDADADEASFGSLMANDEVEWAEPVRMYQMAGFSDPYYKYQWNMAELDLEAVHAKAQGQGVIVAVVDSGVTPGTDGPANLVAGWDFLDNDADATDSAAVSQSPSGSHGTHVAGTIAQTSNNGIGVTGVAPMAKIMPVRVGDYHGATSENIAEGITWAVDHGANVINLSIGGSSPSRVIEEACRYAYDHGVVVVAATGNDGYDGKISYPAAYSTVIAVGAHDGAEKETSYSNNGRELALLAPGGDTTSDANKDGQPDGILQGTITSKGWGYAMMEGTSMASPHVAGAAAVLISAGIKGPDAVRAALIGGAKTVGSARVLSITGALAYKGAVSTTAPSTGTAPAHAPGAATRQPGGPGGLGAHAARPGGQPGSRPAHSGSATGRGQRPDRRPRP